MPGRRKWIRECGDTKWGKGFNAKAQRPKGAENEMKTWIFSKPDSFLSRFYRNDAVQTADGRRWTQILKGTKGLFVSKLRSLKSDANNQTGKGISRFPICVYPRSSAVFSFSRFLATPFTQLKQGVNETRFCVHSQIYDFRLPDNFALRLCSFASLR
jgi:hypothetical protein